MEADDDRTVEALISADLAVGGADGRQYPSASGGDQRRRGVAELGVQKINMYGATDRDEVMRELSGMLRQGYGATPAQALVKSA